MIRYWIGVAPRRHVEGGVAGSFAQLGHGRHAEVKALSKGDWLVYYSPRETLEGNDPVQAFTAIGQVTSEDAYQVTTPGGFEPWRVDVAFDRIAQEAPIRPLLAKLDLTRHRGNNWGMAVRRGRIAATPHDFALIAQAMGIADPTGKDST